MTKRLSQKKTLVFTVVLALASGLTSVKAQEDTTRAYREVSRDTSEYIAPTETLMKKDTVFDARQVLTNKFSKNWFLFGTAGGHTFRGDYSNRGDFKGTLSPDFGIGLGKWFTPAVGLKVEFIHSASRGYTDYMTGHYGYGDVLTNDDGISYRKMKTRWWDISASAILNLSRMILGYEGYDSKKMMNQIMLNVGIGGVHHLGYEHSYGSDNEWGAHVELQYSRFFTSKKRASLDVKARGIFYQTNFDLEYGQANHAANKFDCNLGLDVGFTLYLGKARNNGWGRGAATLYQRDYREREIVIVREREGETVIKKNEPVKYGSITFYVFYPNNYSGRNDAPQIADAKVNAIDYLAGGIFTQKQYTDADKVKSQLAKGMSLNGLAIEDIPTEAANQDFAINYVPRGYEMLQDTPLSLSLSAGDMNAFKDKAGYYYAPIYDGLHVWNYRIDDATLRQQLISGDNYKETASFGLNAHSGLSTIRQYMNVDSKDELVSFADVYAAMTSNEGYISQFTDQETVDRIKEVFSTGMITMIQAEGLATSQDNFTGADAKRVGIERNTALSQNRANTVISWLKQNERFEQVASRIYLVGNMNGIRTVTDKSTRGLNAKLNRCVKVIIFYMMQ